MESELNRFRLKHIIKYGERISSGKDIYRGFQWSTRLGFGPRIEIKEGKE